MNAGKIALIGDTDTISGFLLTGVGVGDKNYFVVKDSTKPEDVAKHFNLFIEDKTNAMIIINQTIASSIRTIVENHVKSKSLPVVIEIPSKGEKYDTTKDSVLKMLMK
ncbi:ATPase, V1 complex, subunit F like protein [Aduncisulcus paluster]|uniref:ATPase, V1 complex, subunit F like protein n=1 Tax=Aduncisulcus paluster TaxID=2918883 RepID=A0ABQ5KS10_9EUKA|nr:ATPase, V1 complex, subunit F like protein [Aduncisulcus paluster]